jgi:hypothetical protein
MEQTEYSREGVDVAVITVRSSVAICTIHYSIICPG